MNFQRGTVVLWNGRYGFIDPSPPAGYETRRKVFVHHTSIRDARGDLAVGETVEFELSSNDRGPIAFEVRRVASPEPARV